MRSSTSIRGPGGQHISINIALPDAGSRCSFDIGVTTTASLKEILGALRARQSAGRLCSSRPQDGPNSSDRDPLGPLTRIATGETLVHTESWMVFSGVSHPTRRTRNLPQVSEPSNAKLLESSSPLPRVGQATG